MAAAFADCNMHEVFHLLSGRAGGVLRLLVQPTVQPTVQPFRAANYIRTG
jgi:hypothetical protein